MVDRRDNGGADGEADGTGDGRIHGRDETEDAHGSVDGPDDPRQASDPPAEARDDGEDDDMSGIFGPRDEPREIVPGNPDPENALFVLLGVLLGVASLLELVGAL